MKKSSKKYFAPALALGILIPTGVYLASEAKAESEGKYPPVIEKLAAKFGVDEEEIKGVFDEQRGSREEDRKAHVEEGLDQAVQDGKITEAQKQLLIAKKEEFRNERQGKREEFKNLSREERREKMQERKGEFKEHHEEFEAWAEENGIDLDELKEYFGGFGQKRGHHPRH